MDGERRRCALPGCTVEFQIAHGRPERRYCTAAHRAAARRVRRAALHGQRHGVAEPAAGLPWREPRTAERVDPGLAVSGAGVPDGAAAGPALHPVVHRVPAGVVSLAAARRARDRRRALRRSQDAQRTGVAVLLRGVAAAARRAVPDDGVVTARVTDDVLDVVRNDGPARAPAVPAARHAAPAGTTASATTPAPVTPTTAPVTHRTERRSGAHRAAPRDDDDIEEQNLLRSSGAQDRARSADRSTGSPPDAPAAAAPTDATPRAAGHAARSFDPHDGYLRLSRLLAGTASSP